MGVFAQTPDWQWAKKIGGPYIENAACVTTDDNGNVYAAGSFCSITISFGTITLTNSGTTGHSDGYIVKYDKYGTALWAKSIKGDRYEFISNITLDLNGNIYVSGDFVSHYIDFGSLSFSNYDVATYPTSDNFLAKYDSTGNVLWAEHSGGVYGDQCVGHCNDNFGNIYAFGTFDSPTITFGSFTLNNPGGAQNFYIVKYDSLGNVIWAKSPTVPVGSFTGTTYKNGSIKEDGNGNVVISGNFKSQTITFGTNTLTNDSIGGGTSDIFLVKYDAGGNVLWAKSAGGTHDDIIRNLVTDSIGNIYISGYFYSSNIDFDIDTLFNASINSDIFLTKYNPAGNVLWAKRAGGISYDKSSVIALDNNENIYWGGSFGDSLIILDTITVTNSAGSIFISKYNPTGNVIWAIGTGNTGYYDYLVSLQKDPYDNLYVTGGFQSSTITFGATTLTNATGGGASMDVFLAKLLRPAYIWPGDADNSGIVDNNDLLPIGLYYGQTGTPRASIDNLWQADLGTNWGITENNGVDIKHANCNGDGIIDDNDTLAINLNFNLTHAIPASNNNYNNERLTAPDIYFITSSSSYNAGDWIDAEVWLGKSAVPVNNLYGIAFNINYNSSLVQPGTESITYPANWLGTPGTNAIKTSKIDAVANTAYGAITRVDHTNTSGFGKIADFKFQIKNTVASSSAMHLSISNYMADNATGVSQVFNTINDSVTINAGSVGITETNTVSEITIFPNPFTSQTTITFNQEQKNIRIKILDVLGKEVKSLDFKGKKLIIEKGEMKEGIYFLQITNGNTNVVNKKIVVH